MEPSATPIKVVVVSTNPATRDPLLSYFRDSGVSADGRGDARGLGRACRSATALVVFPDDLDGDVVAALRSARASSPGVLVLLVTGSPQRYVASLADANAVPPQILAKPVFGWTLLDAIRAHVDEVKP